MFRLLMLMMKL